MCLWLAWHWSSRKLSKWQSEAPSLFYKQWRCEQNLDFQEPFTWTFKLGGCYTSSGKRKLSEEQRKKARESEIEEKKNKNGHSTWKENENRKKSTITTRIAKCFEDGSEWINWFKVTSSVFFFKTRLTREPQWRPAFLLT